MTQSGDDASTTTAFAEAYTEIRNLYARYNWYSDEGDADGYAGCFTEDGELSIPGIGMRIRGRRTSGSSSGRTRPGEGIGSAATGTAASFSRPATTAPCGGGAISTATTAPPARRRC